ncbi:Uncharacterised protein [Chlamydia trachomatis]|nr:Uncharacterised protein [Chlamydia trachomatis]
MSRVDAHHFNPASSKWICDQVEREHLSRGETETTIAPHDDCCHRQIPQALVEECWVKQGSRGKTIGQMRVVDLQTPRQRRGATEKLLIEPVPPAANGLGDQ